jgi:hypothetical protein
VQSYDSSCSVFFDHPLSFTLVIILRALAMPTPLFILKT